MTCKPTILGVKGSQVQVLSSRRDTRAARSDTLPRLAVKVRSTSRFGDDLLDEGLIAVPGVGCSMVQHDSLESSDIALPRAQ